MPGVELAQELLVDPRLVVESLGEAVRDQLAEVAVALVVHGQQDQVVVVFPVAAVDPLALVAAARSHVDLAAEDRLDPGRHRLPVELHRAEHVAVVGHGDGRLPQALGPLDQRGDLVGAVQQAVLGVAMKVYEVVHSHSMVAGGLDETS